MRVASRSQGTNFETKIVNFRWFLALLTETSFITPHYYPKYEVWAIEIFLWYDPFNVEINASACKDSPGKNSTSLPAATLSVNHPFFAFLNCLFFIVYQYLSRAEGPKSLRAESARAVTGRRCPHSGRGEDFLSRQPDFFTETAVTSERKVEKSFPRWEINRHVEG